MGFIFMCALNLCCSDGKNGNAYTKEVLHDPGTSLSKKAYTYILTLGGWELQVYNHLV